jgi:hypothetical protein
MRIADIWNWLTIVSNSKLLMLAVSNLEVVLPGSQLLNVCSLVSIIILN